jgi:hypothetical protein
MVSYLEHWPLYNEDVQVKQTCVHFGYFKMTSYDYDIYGIIGMSKKVLLQTLCHHVSDFGGGQSHYKD